MRRIRTPELNGKRAIPVDLVESIAKYIGKDGTAFFLEMIDKHGEISPVFWEVIGKGRKIPHPVHFREGMQIRNAMRHTGLCKGWSAHDFDDNWIEVIRQALDFLGR